MILILKSYFIFLSVLGVFYIIGNTFISLLIKEAKTFPRYLKTFIALLLGSVITITFFSIWKTNGSTINIIFLVLILYIIFQKKELRAIATFRNIEKKFTFKNFIYLLFSSIIIFTYFLSVSSAELLVPDHIFYSRISFFLSQTGQENEYYIANILNQKFHGASPYHYFELWLTSLITEIFGGLNLNNFILVTGSILLQMIFIGVLAIWERFCKLNLWHFTFTFLLLFSGGLTLPFLEKIPIIGNYVYVGFSILVTNTVKFSVVSLFPLAALLMALYKQKFLPILFLLFLPVVNFAFMPAILGGILLFSFISIFLKYYALREATKSAIFTISIPILIFLFYHFFGITEITRDSTSLKSISENIKTTSVDSLITMFNIIIGASLSMLFLYLPSLILIIYLFIKKHIEKEMLFFGLLILSVLFAGLLSWSLIFKALNSVQIFCLALKPLNLSVIACSIIIISNYKSFTVKRHWFVLALIVFTPLTQIIHKINHLDTSNQKHSIGYLEKINRFINTSDNKLGVFIKDSSDYFDPFSKYPSFSVLGGYLGTIDNSAIAVSISEFNIPLNNNSIEEDMKAIKTGVFYQFVQEEKKKKSFVSINNSQMNFIKKFKIKYLIISSNSEIPTFTKNSIKEVFEDSETGEKFLVLKDID